jgi:hypothetical protein
MANYTLKECVERAEKTFKRSLSPKELKEAKKLSPPVYKN